MNQRELFFRHVAQTSPAPLALEIVKASGSFMTDRDGRQYLDLIAGISVCNVGHAHPAVVEAIQKQSQQYLHLLVYGEFVETPQVQYAKALAQSLPASLNSVYFTNSGAEATEGAMKLAKRVTGRTEIIAFQQSYHGSTQGALSIMGDEYWRNAFRPLLPDVRHELYNSEESLAVITERTACVIAETVQAERGVVTPDPKWIKALRERCTQTGTLLILDEIQTGFGRTGSLWGFEQYDVVPDVVLLGKALGGGMPLGAFVADKSLMDAFTHQPVLGHITTFGGHPVCCAAGLAAFGVLQEENWVQAVKAKSDLICKTLQHPQIKAVRAAGLLVAIELESPEAVLTTCKKALESGLIIDWFLFAPNCLRLAPPLSISLEELQNGLENLLKCLDRI